MSVENRYRRKKTFKSNERSELVEASNAAACKQDEVTTLNVRRSSRKPKPKRHDNEGNVSTGLEETEKPSGEGGADAKMTFAGVESGEIFLGTGIRRETRKTYQNYLEKLGYNTDFSKISPADSPTHPIKAKAGSSRKTINKQSKTEEKAATKRSRDSQNEKSLSVEEKTVMTKIRASARTPKPRRTFALLEDDATAHSKDTSDTCKPGRIVQNAFDSPDLSSGTEVKLPRVVKTQKSSSDKRNQEQRLLKGQKQMASARQEVLTTAPLSKHDIDEAEVLSDADDSSHPRTSTRIRIPKRKFSLIEEVPPTEMKKQKIMSPEHCGDIEVCKDNKVLEPNNTSMQSPSSLVVKRSDTRKQKANRRKGNLNESRLSPSKEKDKHIGKKMEVSNNSHSEIENKPGSGRSKQKIVKEPFIKKLKVLKETPVVGKSKKIKKNKDIKNEDVSSQKNTVRKEDNDNLKKGKMQNEGKETKNDSKEHIVLKLTIPHGSPRSEEKEKMHDKQHHKHHHHHRHKKEKKDSESDVNKKIKSEHKGNITVYQEICNEDIVEPETEVKTKKKKKKVRDSKEESSESFSDSTAIPHVKLVIKKSPVKPKDVKVMINDDSSKTSIPSIPTQDSDKQNGQSGKSDLKVETPTTEHKPSTKSPRKAIKKDVKFKTVSAYSLFTKSRRKNLLEREPDLDFANTSRKLAEMWKELPLEDKEYWRCKAKAIRKPSSEEHRGNKGSSLGRKGRQDFANVVHSKDSDYIHSSGTDPVDMAAYLKLLGESLCSIGICLKRQDQMEVHGSLSVLLDTALCSIVPLFCLTSQLPEMAGCPPETQAEILDNLAYIIPGL